jgi:hypothetical protein
LVLAFLTVALRATLTRFLLLLKSPILFGSSVYLPLLTDLPVDDNFNDGINLNSFNYVADGNYKARHQR